METEIAVDEEAGKLFCIGDIHGCNENLKALMEVIPVNYEQDTLVFLGDYINRGPDSAKVLDTLIEIQKKCQKTVFLKGNHEQVLLEYAESGDVDMVPTLRMMGVEATAASYGARVRSLQSLSCFPENHKKFLCSLQFAWGWGNYVFTHADITEELIASYSRGERPEGPDAQQEALLLGGRRFLEQDRHVEGITVVFGHSPFLTPLVVPHRICIDTGAVYGNRLTGLELPVRRFYHG